ncbi:MFS transporter [Jeotgalibacillus proteolyticus]|uniref:MFS transporter n=1 Tax=Jeotgalibacillus proteolyticus TaxID=2082395 RepID=A0A2S5GC25_9BACL|nr:MFS transporter [Jeotgalibacillus proteolyticus]PPA70587.1 MFS transporter [Jeotgalibacillus proteolyticus]
MKQQNWLSVNFFTFFFTWGIFLPYWTGWLVFEKGLTVGAASTIIAAGLFTRSFSTLFLFPELTKRFSLALLMKILPIVSACLLLLFIPAQSFSALMIVMILFSLFYPNVLPLMESSATVLMKTNGINYGRSRSFGSAGYTVSLIFIGVTTAIWTESSIMAMMIIGTGLLIMTSFLQAPDALATKSAPQLGGYRAIFKTPGFAAVLSICVLIQGSHAAYYSYGFIYLQELQVSSIYIGFILNIAVLSEIVFFAVADRFFGRTTVSAMFIFAAAATAIRWILVGLFPSLWMFVLTQMLHSLTFGLAHYAFIKYIYRAVDKQLIPTAQGLYASLGMGLSTALLTQIGGSLYEVSSGLSFIGMGLAVIPAFFIGFWLSARKLA